MESAGRNERAEKALQAEAGLDQGTEERRGKGDGRAAEAAEHRPRQPPSTDHCSPSLGPGAESWEEALSPEGSQA